MAGTPEHPRRQRRTGRPGPQPGDGKRPSRHRGRRVHGSRAAAGHRLLDRRIRTFVIANVTPFQEEIGAFISEVVRSWDAQTISSRLELAVGRDLQFIRINGTLVGAAVGCCPYLLVSLVELL
jgi:hypothetical protein